MLSWGRGMNGGRLMSIKCIYSCLVDYNARETSGSGVLLCALEALCHAAENVVSWGFLLVKLDWHEEWAEHGLSIKLPKTSTDPIAPECKRERWWHPLQSLLLDCDRWHPVPSWVPAAIYCFVSPETAPVVGDTVPPWALILHWSVSTSATFEQQWWCKGILCYGPNAATSIMVSTHCLSGESPAETLEGLTIFGCPKKKLLLQLIFW